MKIGIIGGSGLEDPEFIQEYEEKDVDTPYGKPSSKVICGKIAGEEVCILSRHGKGHVITPTNVNNRANIYALGKEGCTHIIATSASGSLKQEIERGDFVILSDLIDFTKQRAITFHDNFLKGVNHVSLADPFSEEIRRAVILAAEELGIKHHKKGVVITIEGPRFGTRAESNLFRQWGADVVNMSIAPEATLAREAGLEYAAIAMSTDYDCWKQNEENVSWGEITRVMKENAEKVKKLILRSIEKLSTKDEDYIKSKIISIPNWPKPGVVFRDITSLIEDSEGMKKVIDIFERRYKEKGIKVVAAIESRGFIFGSLLAQRLNASLVILRKPGKLPRETERQEYELEYGRDAIEVHKDAIKPGDRVLLVDDLIATGGTAKAAVLLIERLGGHVVECGFVIELPELRGREKLIGYPIFRLVEFEGS
ncbi:MAG: S-methyl-5'-thioadenosine phosphorylase [archaeon]